MPKKKSNSTGRKHAAEGPTPRQLRWAKIVEEQKASGLTVRAFCRKRNLKESNFWYWRREILRRGLLRGTSKKAPPTRKRQRLLPVKIVGPVSHQVPLELVCCTGRSVRIAGDVPLELLRKVVAVAEESR